MKKEQLIELIKKLLKTNLNLDFLLALDQKDIEALVACIRDRLEEEK